LEGGRFMSSSASSAAVRIQPIRFWQHGRAVRQIVRAYPQAPMPCRSTLGGALRLALQLLPPFTSPASRGGRYAVSSVKWRRSTSAEPRRESGYC
jgi:hypothetical protein